MQPRLLKHPARLAGASLLRLQDDVRLVALAREGHDPAFAAIVDRYAGQLERYCARLLGAARAEDAVQQAFVNAHAAMRASDQELVLKPWLYRVAHNAALNILRSSRDEDALDSNRPGAVLTAEVVELRERLRETLASIQALPGPQRDALLLRELEGRSHEEIAAALGVTEGGARQHLHRARLSVRAAASAMTPYPLIARVLSAAASEGSRGADLVSGAGIGAGAGAVKIAAGVLAAGAIAGGAVGVQQSTRAGRAGSGTGSTTAPGSANRPSAGLLEVADDLSAGARSRRGREHGRGHDDGARGRGRHHGEHHRSGSDDRRRGSDEGHSSGDDHRGSSGGGEGTQSGHDSGGSGSGSSGSGSSGSGSSGSGSSGSGSSGSGSHDGSSGSGDTTTEAAVDDSLTTTGDGGSSGGSGSDGGSGSSGGSGSDGGGSQTATTPLSTSGSDDH